MVDRLVIDEKIRVRLSDSVETALKWGEGVCCVAPADQPSQSQSRERTARSEGNARPVDRNTAFQSQSQPGNRQELRAAHAQTFFLQLPCGRVPGLPWPRAKNGFRRAPGRSGPRKSLEQGAVLPWRRGGKRMIVYYKAMLRGVGQPIQAEPGNALQRFAGRLSNRRCCTAPAKTEIEFNFWRAGKAEQDQATI